MKLDNNLFISNGATIKHFKDHIQATTLDTWSTPGIKYNTNITLHANTEYIFCIEGDFTNIDNDSHIFVKSIENNKRIYYSRYSGYDTLLYKYRSEDCKKNYFVIKHQENVSEMVFYILTSKKNKDFKIYNVFIKKLDEKLVISNYILNNNFYNVSFLYKPEFEIPIHISSSNSVELSTNLTYLNEYNNNKLIIFKTSEPYIEINHIFFHKTVKFKVYQNLIIYNTENSIYFNNYIDIKSTSFNLNNATNNQNTTLEFNNNELKVISNQDTSTPGIKFEDFILLKKNTTYRLEVYGRKEDQGVTYPYIVNEDSSYKVTRTNNIFYQNNNGLFIDQTIEGNEDIINKNDYGFINKKYEQSFHIPDIENLNFSFYMLFSSPKVNSTFYISKFNLIELVPIINPEKMINYCSNNNIINTGSVTYFSSINDVYNSYIQFKENNIYNELLIQDNHYINIPIQLTIKNNYNDLIKTNFNQLLSIFNDSTNGGWYSNDNSRYVWEYSYYLESLIKLYKITYDKYYLNLFVEIGNRIINTTDKKLGIKDKFRNDKSLVGWSCSRYTYLKYKDRRISHIHDSHTSNICWRLLQFYNLVYKYNLSEYKQFANNYLDTSFEAFDVIEEDWVETPGRGGFVQNPWDKRLFPDGENPLNRNNICGLFCLELYRATKQLKYKNYFKKICEYFNFYINREGQTALIYDNCLTWDYMPNINEYHNIDGTIKILTPRCEDLSHGSYACDIIYEGFKENIIFTREHLVKLANTFKTLCWNGKEFEVYIDGHYRDDYNYVGKHIVSKYLLLNEFDSDIYPLIDFFYQNRKCVSNVSLSNNVENKFYHYAAYVILPFVNLLYYKT